MDSDDRKPTQLTRVTSLSDSDLFIVSIDIGTAPKTRAIQKSDAITGGGGGGLTTSIAAVTISNVTGVEDTHHILDVSGMTANRDFNLPTPSAAGKRCKVTLSAGDDTYALLVKVNTVEVTRLFITNETLEFVSTGTGAGNWQLSQDGRIPCIAILERQAAQSINTSTGTKIAFDAAPTNRGDMGDITTNDRVNIRRTNTYIVSGFTSVGNVLDDQEFLEAEIYKNGSLFKFKRDYVSSGTANRFASPESIARGTYNAGDNFELYIFHNEGATQDTDITYPPTLAVIEQL